VNSIPCLFRISNRKDTKELMILTLGDSPFNLPMDKKINFLQQVERKDPLRPIVFGDMVNIFNGMRERTLITSRSRTKENERLVLNVFFIA
jgi:hypothetical protein